LTAQAARAEVMIGIKAKWQPLESVAQPLFAPIH
jgi:hypothetical protein